MVTGQALLGVLKQHGGVPSMWPNDVIQHICCMSTITTSGVEGSTCTTPKRLQRTDVLPFRKQPYSSMSDGGTAHNSYWNMVVSSNVDVARLPEEE